jgi:glycolate oxidase iron-sulfur subunit
VGLGPKTRDLFEFLAEVGLPEPTREVKVRVTYQDPCHLAHAQRITRQPRDLLRAVPGVEFVEMPHADICCGSAGIYNVLEPAMSARILAEKMDNLLSVEPELVVTANPGCQMQLQAGVRSRGRRIPVKHLAELLADSY